MKKQQRLTGRDIAYLLKKGKKLSWTYFWWYMMVQSTYRPYHQRSITIPTKIDKRSTKRNMLKRYLNEQWMSSIVGIPSAKVFLMLHKHHYQRIQQLIATRDKKAIRELLSQWSTCDFTVFVQHLCRLSSDRSGSGMSPSAKVSNR